MIYRNYTVATPTGTYFQKLYDKETGKVRELRVYLYTEHFRNKENGNMPSHKSKAIGACVSVDDTSRMYPNDNYFELIDTNIPESVLQQRREFEEKKKSSSIKKSDKAKRYDKLHSSMQSVSSDEEQIVQGTALLLGLLSEKLGLTDALKAAVQGELKLLDDISTIAAMLCEGHNAMMHLPDFTARATPGSSLDGRRASDIFASITRDFCKRFFIAWIKQHYQKKGTVYYDVTSFSTRAKNIQIAEYGYNRDHEDLPQLNLGLVVDRLSRLPLSFCIYNGSLNDPTQFPYVLQELKNMGLSVGLIFTMDRAFGDGKRIKFLHDLGYKLLVGISLARMTSLFTMIDVAVQNRQYLSLKYMLPDFENIFALRQEYTYNGVQGVLFFYFDINKNAEETQKVVRAYRNLNKKIKALDEKYKNNKCKLPAKEVFKFKKFFSVTEDESSPYGWSITEDDSKFRLWFQRCGWFCLFTTDFELTPNEALLNYRDKECAESTFDTCKNTMGGRRLRTHNDATTIGKLFVEFISLIQLNSLYKSLKSLKIRDPKHFNKFTMKNLLREFADIQFIQGRDKSIRLLKAPTALQQKLLDELGISVEQFKVDADSEASNQGMSAG